MGRTKPLSSEEICCTLKKIADNESGSSTNVTTPFHSFSSTKTSSSLRTVVAKGIVQAAAKPKTKRQKQRQKKKNRKQRSELLSVEPLPAEDGIQASILQKFCVVFTMDGDIAKPNFSDQSQNYDKPIMVSLCNWKVTDTGQGGSIFHPIKNELPVFIKPPYQSRLMPDKVIHDIIQVLKSVEKKAPNQRRGKSKFLGLDGPNSKYVAIGIHANRGGRGLIQSKLNMMSTEEKETLVSFIRRLEEIFQRWVDWSYLTGFRNAAVHQDITMLDDGHRATEFFSSVAFGRNVYLQAHTDCDFGYSIVVVLQVEPEETDLDEILCYFVFPVHAQVVALRHGDIIIFNPTIYHCVSKKSVTGDVFCLSCYLKTAVVGKNDNLLPLTRVESEIARLQTKGT